MFFFLYLLTKKKLLCFMIENYDDFISFSIHILFSLFAGCFSCNFLFNCIVTIWHDIRFPKISWQFQLHFGFSLIILNYYVMFLFSNCTNNTHTHNKKKIEMSKLKSIFILDFHMTSLIESTGYCMIYIYFLPPTFLYFFMFWFFFAYFYGTVFEFNLCQ